MSLSPDWHSTLQQWSQISDDDRARYTSELDELAASFAGDVGKRISFGKPPTNWILVKDAWAIAKEAEDIAFYRLTLSLARFTRNLVAQVPENQEETCQFEPDIFACIVKLTSFSLLEDEKSWPSLRMSVQLLSNMITSNASLVHRFWEKHIANSEDRNIVLRVLESPDPMTAQSCFILLLNALYSSPTKATDLLHSSGHRILVSLLDKLELLSEGSDGSAPHKAFQTGYRLFLKIIENVAPDVLWASLELNGVPVTPTRIVFLKILDAYLHSEDARTLDNLESFTFLASELDILCLYATHSVRQSLAISANTGEMQLQNLDSLLPRVCQAQILSSHCLITLLLMEQSTPLERERHLVVSEHLKNKTKSFVEDVIDCLRQLDLFLPRIMYGKAVNAKALGQHHPDPTGFTNLKRDLVRLLGILVYEDVGIQDRIRSCDGIPVIMNLCVADERNPLLREHALFALRNTLQGNIENQKVVDAIQPSGYWDEDGVLRDITGATRK